MKKMYVLNPIIRGIYLIVIQYRILTFQNSCEMFDVT